MKILAVMEEQVFYFKGFRVIQSDEVGLKVNTDSVLLGSWVSCCGGGRILDIGAGIGTISLILAKRCPKAYIYAVEIDDVAFSLLGKNFALSPWKERLKAILADIKDYASEGKFDCIVSNPPYFSKALKSSDERKALARHDQGLTLEELIFKIDVLLKDSGEFFLILPAEQYENFEVLANYNGFYCRELVKIYTSYGKRYKRVMVRMGRGISSCEKKELILRRDGKVTEQYRRMTQDIYLRLK